MSDEKIGPHYKGCMFPSGAVVLRPDRTLLPLDRSLKVMPHSPTGFAWGYTGSGPHQLALALLLDVLPETRMTVKWAVSLYHQLVHDMVSKWDSEGHWVVEARTLRRWASLTYRKPGQTPPV